MEAETPVPEAEHYEVSPEYVCLLLSSQYGSALPCMGATHLLQPHSLEVPQEYYLHREC